MRQRLVLDIDENGQVTMMTKLVNINDNDKVVFTRLNNGI